MQMDANRQTEISKRAHCFWELEGRPNGRDLCHWLRAEAEFDAVQYSPIEKAKPVKPRREKDKRQSSRAGSLG
jgi:Protein of unknown function (DUF2934)